MKKLLLYVLVINSFFSFSQNEMYVNTSGGLNIRSKPNSKSQKISKLNCGEKLTVIEKTSEKISVTDNEKTINGNWIKVSNGKISGYVFDGFLTEKIPEILYSINVIGTKVFSKPNFNSKVKTIYKPGKIFICENTIKTNETYFIGKGFELEGDWKKIKGFDGYIFSSDLSNKKPNFYKSGHISPNVFGKLISEKTIEKQKGNSKLRIREHIKKFENGKYTYTEHIGDACFYYVYELWNVSISEVYHQMVSQNLSIGETQIWTPEFYKKENNLILFNSEDLTEDLKITINKDGSFIISSYSCT